MRYPHLTAVTIHIIAGSLGIMFGYAALFAWLWRDRVRRNRRGIVGANVLEAA
jgi:hypothetical protein